MAKTKMQILIETKIGKAQKDLDSLKNQVSNVGTATEQTTKKVGFFRGQINKLSDSMKVLSAIGLVGIVTGLVNATKALFTFNKELKDSTKLVEDLTGKSGEDLRKFTADIQATADTFKKDFKEILIATNALSKEMGITAEESLGIIQQGFIKGADAGGEMLSNIAEFSTQAKRAGLDAKEFIQILDTTTEKGVFSDKGIDSIKEATIRLGEMPKATKEAIDSIGISSEKMQKDLESGNKTFFQSMQEISRELAKLPPQSSKVGEVIANVFGGAGEDAQSFILSMGEINLELSKQNKELTETEKLKEQDLQNQQRINDLMSQFFGESNTGFSKMITQLTTISLDLIDGIIEGVKGTITWFENLTDQTKILRMTIASIGSFFTVMWENAKNVLGLMATTFKSVGSIIEGVFTLDTEKIKQGYVNVFEGVKQVVVDGFKAIQEEQKNLEEEFAVTNEEARKSRVLERQETEKQEAITQSQALNQITQDAFDKLNRQIFAKTAKFNRDKVKVDARANKVLIDAKKKVNKEIKDDTIQNQLATLQFEKGAGKQALKIASSKAVGSMIASIMSSVPFPFNVALAVGANTVVAGIFDKIPAFEEGGIVGGNSFTGDNNLIRVNSGEEVVRRDNPRHILNQGDNYSSSSIDNLANKIETLTDEIAFGEKNIDINNVIDISPTNLLEVTEAGDRDRSRIIDGV